MRSVWMPLAGVSGALLAGMLLAWGAGEPALQQESDRRPQRTADEERKGAMKKLTPAQERIIVHKGTEAPGSGKYYRHDEPGVYRCARCDEPLFSSDAKFDSGCGWPAFDAALPGAVRETADADGRRTEIVCARCGAHLGHVFRGEGFTAADTRHCVNSISLDFEPAAAAPDGQETAYFAGGCFWGVEYHFERVPGVLDAVSGYMGGSVANPSYRQVSNGDTGHAETVKVVFNPARVSFSQLAALFFDIHDPTQLNRQGPDIGPQYRSAVFYASEEQRRAVLNLIERLKARGYRVTTVLNPAGAFYPAEDYHQDYYETTGKQPYCHVKADRFGTDAQP